MMEERLELFVRTYCWSFCSDNESLSATMGQKLWLAGPFLTVIANSLIMVVSNETILGSMDTATTTEASGGLQCTFRSLEGIYMTN